MRLAAPSFVASIISLASGLLFMSPEQAPFCMMPDAGQPIFRSMPSKPISINFFAALKKFSGRVPHIWATKGRSASVYRSLWVTGRSPFENIPSTLVNSVKKTAGLPHRAITCLSTVSVTSSIGARIKIGLFNSFQKFFMLKIVHVGFMYGKRGKVTALKMMQEELQSQYNKGENAVLVLR